MKQRTEEWHQARRGFIGASTIYRIMTATTPTLEKLRAEVRELRDSPKDPIEFSGAAMAWGNQHEPRARASVEMELGYDFEEVGLLVHREHFYVGASPDGLNRERRQGLELKCPWRTDNHRAHRQKIPSAYMWQMQAGMWVTGFEEWVFGSFDPRLLGEDPAHHTIVHTVARSERMMAMLEERVPWFWRSV